MTSTSKLLAATALVLLFGCSTETATQEVSTTTTTVETPNINNRDLYLVSVNNGSFRNPGWADTDLLTLGEAVCESFGTGKSLSEVADIFSTNLGRLYSDELFSVIAGSSVTFLCPELAVYVDGQI